LLYYPKIFETGDQVFPNAWSGKLILQTDPEIRQLMNIDTLDRLCSGDVDHIESHMRRPFFSLEFYSSLIEIRNSNQLH
jgi:hypothetical protein